MKIKIERFCKYIEYQINFNQFKTCLFQGASGEGKTTLFEAIRFCLYGNNSNIYPSGDVSKANRQTKVTLEIPEYSDLIISRCKPPEVLSVSVSGVHLESLAAQEYIDNLFGNFSMFLATTYLVQGQRHPLISLSNKEKFDLLSLLTFGLNSEEHPDTFINTIETQIKDLDKKLEKKILEREYNLQKLTSGFEEISVEEVETLDQKLLQLISRIETTALKWEKTLTQENQEHNLKSQLASVTKKLLDIERCPQLEALSETQLRKLKEYLSLPLLIKVEKSLNYDKTFSLTETGKLISELQHYNKILEKKNNLEIIPYSLDNVENMKKYTVLKEKLVPPRRKVEAEAEALKYDLQFLLKAKKLLKILPQIYYTLNPQDKDDFLEYFHSLKEKPKIWLQPDLSTQEYQKQISLAEEKSREDKICKSYKISKDKDKIQESIKIIETHLNFQVEYTQHKKTQESLQNLTPELKSKEKELQDLQDKYSDKLKIYNLVNLEDLKQRTGDGYTCPQCQVNLLLSKGVLIKCDLPAIPQDKALKFQEYFKKELRLSSQISDLKKEIEKLTAKTFPSGPIYDNPTKILKMLQDLKSLTFVDTDANIEDIKILYECAKFKEKYPHLKIPPPEVLSDTSNIKHLNLYIDIQDQLQSFPLTFEETVEMIELHQDFIIQEEFNAIQCQMLKYQENNFSLTEIKNLEKKIIQNQTIQQMLDEELSKITLSNLSLEELQSYKEKTLVYEAYVKYKNLKQENQVLRESLDFDFEGLTLTQFKKFNKSLLNEWLEQKEELAQKLNQIIIKESSIKLKDKKVRLEKKKLSLVQKIEESKICVNISQQNKYIKRYESKKLSMEKIKALAIQARSQTLQQFVNNLNISVNKILTELFEDEIQVKLQLEKQNKSNAKVRSVVNFFIEYRGYQFDSPMSLSGGERDRLSLALMIALASVCGSKIVLLDECLSSLNEELRLVCIQTLNKYLPGKTVINVCHSVTQGFHDETVNIK